MAQARRQSGGGCSWLGSIPRVSLLARPLTGCPFRFLQDLEQRLERRASSRFSVVRWSCSTVRPSRRVYLPYVTNQAYQERTYQRLL